MSRLPPATAVLRSCRGAFPASATAQGFRGGTVERAGTADVWAANPVTLQEIADALPGTRIVPGAWTTGRYAVSLPKGRSPAAQGKLAEWVTEAKRTGVVQRAIDRAGFGGVRVAPE